MLPFLISLLTLAIVGLAKSTSPKPGAPAAKEKPPSSPDLRRISKFEFDELISMAMEKGDRGDKDAKAILEQMKKLAGTAGSKTIKRDHYRMLVRLAGSQPEQEAAQEAKNRKADANPTENADLPSMKVADLKAYAESAGIDLGNAKKKADIVAAIEAADEQQKAALFAAIKAGSLDK